MDIILVYSTNSIQIIFETIEEESRYYYFKMLDEIFSKRCIEIKNQIINCAHEMVESVERGLDPF